jgi:hypothetical protein
VTETAGPPRALGAALVAVVVTAFVVAEWQVAGFRTAMGWLSPRMATLLYLVAAVALAGSMVRRFRPSRRGGRAGIRVPDRVRRLAGPAATSACITAFLVPLFGAWARGTRPPVTVAGITVAGIVPYSDGVLWFGGAERLLFDGSVDDFGAKRPLNPALFAVRLALTHLDLRLALVLQALLLGAACCLLARVVARHLGPAAALALLAGIFGFAGYFAATTYTEPLGVTFGALAAAALWTALVDRNPRLFAGGLFLLSVALGVRAGAFAVLVLVPLWLAWSSRPARRRVAWPVLGLGVAAVVAGLAVNPAASVATGGSPANLYSNSTYLVYGLAMGYPGWDSTPDSWGRVLTDHPEVLALDDAQRAVAVRRLAVQAVRDYPARFAASLARSELNYLREAARRAVPVPDARARRGLQVAAVLLAALALHRRREEGWPALLVDAGLFGATVLCLPALLLWGGLSGLPGWLGGAVALVAYWAFLLRGSGHQPGPGHAPFLLVVMAGVLASLPLIGTDTARVLAATVPLMALLPALAVAVLARGRDGDRPPVAPAVPVDHRRWTPVGAGVALVVVALVGAPLAAATTDRPAVERKTCPDGSAAQAILGGVSVRIVEDEAAAARGGVDAIDVGSATREMEKIAGFSVVQPLVRPGTTIVAGQNEHGDDRIVFLTGSVRASGSSVLYFCGGDLGDHMSTAFSYFWPKPVDFAYMTGTPLDP